MTRHTLCRVHRTLKSQIFCFCCQSCPKTPETDRLGKGIIFVVMWMVRVPHLPGTVSAPPNLQQVGSLRASCPLQKSCIPWAETVDFMKLFHFTQEKRGRWYSHPFPSWCLVAFSKQNYWEGKDTQNFPHRISNSSDSGFVLFHQACFCNRAVTDFEIYFSCLQDECSGAEVLGAVGEVLLLVRQMWVWVMLRIPFRY